MTRQTAVDQRKLTEFRKAIWIAAADNYERIFEKQLAAEDLARLTDIIARAVPSTTNRGEE